MATGPRTVKQRRTGAMSVENRMEALKEKHKALDAALEEEFSRPHPDDLEIHNLKKQKLRIKDEIASIATQ
jgi:hypothetical protein